MNTIQKHLSIVQQAVDKHQKLPSPQQVARECGVSLFKAKAIIRRYMIYQYIKRYIEVHDFSPTRQEIANMLGLSLSATQYHVEQLANARLINVPPSRFRAISMPEKSA